MAGERMQRRLAAILAADVAGYSRLMGSDVDFKSISSRQTFKPARVLY
jgi:adenylate cyclase